MKVCVATVHMHCCIIFCNSHSFFKKSYNQHIILLSCLKHSDLIFLCNEMITTGIAVAIITKVVTILIIFLMGMLHPCELLILQLHISQFIYAVVSHFHQYLVLSDLKFFPGLVAVKWLLVLSVYISLNSNDIEHLFSDLFFSIVKCLFFFFILKNLCFFVEKSILMHNIIKLQLHNVVIQFLKVILPLQLLLAIFPVLYNISL